jgi:hypothetical protein
MIGIFSDSCKSKGCPEFDLLDKSIISFRLNDTIYYKSDMNDTLILVVFDFYAEEARDGEWDIVYWEEDCYPSASYITNENRGISIKESSNIGLTVSFCVDKEYFLWGKEEIENDRRMQFVSNGQINGIAYSYIIEVEDLSSQRRIDRFIKVENYGIIEFHDRDTGLTWTQM